MVILNVREKENKVGTYRKMSRVSEISERERKKKRKERRKEKENSRVGNKAIKNHPKFESTMQLFVSRFYRNFVLEFINLS